MDLKNIQKVENLIIERNSILKFKAKTINNADERILHINDAKFEAEFLRPIYSQKFVEEMNKTINDKCDEYIEMIDNQLKGL